MPRFILALSALAIPLPFAAMPVLAVTFMSGGGAPGDTTYVQITSEPPVFELPDAVFIDYGAEEVEAQPVAMSLEGDDCGLADGASLAGG